MRTPLAALLTACLLPAAAGLARASDAASLLLDVECRLRAPDEGTACTSLSGFLNTRVTFYDADPRSPLHVEERLQRYDAGTVHLYLNAGGDADLFRTLFDTPESSVLNAPGLRLRLERRKADGTWARVTDVRYRPVAHALYARHSEDTPMLLDRIDQAEAGAIDVARVEAERLVVAESGAREAADLALQAELAALRAAPGATVLPTDCAAGQLLVANGAGGFGCGSMCGGPMVDCDGIPENACETDVSRSLADCGGCGLTCADENIEALACVAGACSGACAPGFGDCNGDLRADGCERIVLGDPLNCGGCDRVCSANHIDPVCDGDACAGACEAGYADCDADPQSNGCEADLASDPLNCGGCGLVCAQPPGTAATCVAGVCQTTCSSGIDCNGDMSDGCEARINSIDHCGACNAPCSTQHVVNATCGLTCAANICFPPARCLGSCEPGYADCDHNLRSNGCEVDLQRNRENCGACGRTCGAGQICSQGQCTGLVIMQ
jgi:hypothetical protein